jgi:tetratricopeptide (TPR) repeat protein
MSGMRGIRRIGALSLPLAAWLAVAGCQRHGEHSELGDRTKTGRLAPELKNLGDYQRRISTKSADAQRFFTQGLILVYGFNHAEALRSFQESTRLDPDCGMMYWGQALALAPNINDSAVGPDREQQGFEAIQKALSKRGGLSAVESALIEALAARFTAAEKPNRELLNKAYAEAMAKVYGQFPDDPDVATLYADAVMNTMPWDYWTKDGKPRPGTSEALTALEKAIQVSPDHPGAHHLYIHAVEASHDPDRAVPSAEKLGGLVPAAGHLVHMPSHIFIRVGRYSDAAEANIRAIAADEDYISQCRAQGIYPAAYYPHNIHFLFAALSMEGRSREAIEAARKVATRHDHHHLAEPGFGFAHLLRTMPYFAMLRFGRWDEMLAEPEPAGSTFVTAMWRYGRGTALAAKGDAGKAQAELQELARLAKAPELAEMKIFDLNSLDKLAAIAEALLEGEIAAVKKDAGKAVKALRRAVEIEESLLYSEPPDWPLPPRHILGAALLEFGRAKEAEQCFREDLRRHRNNGWALRGLVRSLEMQGRKAEAARVSADFQKAWANADLSITSSRL